MSTRKPLLSHDYQTSTQRKRKQLIVTLISTIIICSVLAIIGIVVIPIGILNSQPPVYCYSTDELKSFEYGTVIDIELNNNLVFNLFKKGNLIGKFKYRSWAIPSRIDLITNLDQGSIDGRLISLSLNTFKVELNKCQNSSEIPFLYFGKINYDLMNYKIYDENNNLNLIIEKYDTVWNNYNIKSTTSNTIYGTIKASENTYLNKNWKLTIQTHNNQTQIDWRRVLYIIPSIYYNTRYKS
ncbi:predicted protein [Naegleria gruberi]|uniref:Predicted protein n=1 Tax=Naegleria gruberi TaxID=5762 RepID=D2VCS9_NAEGR|nr:uncharacterized protein NAEGRDRAFT_66679 [Naegleria gruberi]EFC45472.1 predicted protein [Naegleria gruberi]|eukprot:XP_002678216.1 predicted protein [Naegleria gruberi strain NEG-M]